MAEHIKKDEIVSWIEKQKRLSKLLTIMAIQETPAADVVSREEYNHLCKIASKMHLWIFKNSFDEQEVYDELGLTDEDNALLGYGGRIVIKGRIENND